MLEEVDWSHGLDADMWDGLGRLVSEALKALTENPSAMRQAEMLALNFTDAIRDKLGEWPIAGEGDLLPGALMFAGLHVLDTMRGAAGLPGPDEALELFPPIGDDFLDD
jgi:hypothetical protein